MTDFVFLDFKVSADGDCSLDIRRWLLLGRKAMTKLEHVLKSKDIILLTKVRIIKPMVFPVVMYRCETWTIKRALKNQCFYTVVLENTIESPLENKEIKLVNLKGNQPWIFSGKTDAEAEVPIFWPPDANSWLFGKDSDAGKHWRQKEKRDQTIKCLDGIIDSMDMNLGKFQEVVRDRKAWHAVVHEVTKS